MIEKAVARVPQLQGGRHDPAQGHHRDEERLERHSAGTTGKFYESRKYPDLEILDRVGGGDSFASGLHLRLPVAANDPQKAVDYGAAHGALAMTTPGDTSMATSKEVEKTMGGGSARVVR